MFHVFYGCAVSEFHVSGFHISKFHVSRFHVSGFKVQRFCFNVSMLSMPSAFEGLGLAGSKAHRLEAITY